MALLELDNLSVSYGAIRAVREVSLCVEEGEIVTLIGANGAGKSTTLKAVSCLLKPSAGRIVFAGKELTRSAPDEVVRAGIAHCPEGRQILVRQSVRDNLELGGYVRRDRAGVAEDIRRMFRLFPRLEERSRQPAGTLSGGEQQMLAIARALMSRPRLLLLDEPSLGLAPLIVREIFRHHQGSEPGRDDHPAGGAERPAGHAALPAHLCPGGRPGDHLRPFGRADRRPAGTAGLSGGVGSLSTENC